MPAHSKKRAATAAQDGPRGEGFLELEPGSILHEPSARLKAAPSPAAVSQQHPNLHDGVGSSKVVYIGWVLQAAAWLTVGTSWHNAPAH